MVILAVRPLLLDSDFVYRFYTQIILVQLLINSWCFRLITTEASVADLLISIETEEK